MSTPPQRPTFAFTANNATPDDKSGAARWTLPVNCRGGWTTEQLTMPFASFTEAYAVHTALLNTWEAGEASGYAECKHKVMTVLLAGAPR